MTGTQAGRQAGSHSVMQLTDVKAAQKEERDICSNAQTNKGPRYLKKLTHFSTIYTCMEENMVTRRTAVKQTKPEKTIGPSPIQ